jgi:hypothetical protein
MQLGPRHHWHACGVTADTQAVGSGGVERQAESGRYGGGDGADSDNDDRDSTAVWRGLDVVALCVAGLLLGYVVRGAGRGWSPLDRQLEGSCSTGGTSGRTASMGAQRTHRCHPPPWIS